MDGQLSGQITDKSSHLLVDQQNIRYFEHQLIVFFLNNSSQ